VVPPTQPTASPIAFFAQEIAVGLFELGSPPHTNTSETIVYSTANMQGVQAQETVISVFGLISIFGNHNPYAPLHGVNRGLYPEYKLS
jgi:hypothetical protein